MAAVTREYPEYMFGWIGRNISFLDGAATPAAAPVSGVQVSTGLKIPANAMVLQIFIVIPVGFNAATTNTLDVGSAANPTAVIAAATISGVSVSAFVAVTGLLSATTDTEIFTRYNFTGAAPTAGSGRIAVKFIVDPDRRK